MNKPTLARYFALGLALGLSAASASKSDPVPSHLARGQAYLAQGEYARAVIEFEQVLRFDNLPPDLREQAEVYARAARDYQAGRPLSAFGYAESGGGYYRENVTRTTNASGRAPVRDWFWKARIGGGLSYILRDDLAIDGNLDYRFRYYDDSGRRDDSDLRWNAVLVHSLANGSQGIGVRGRASYRGADGYRQDYGLFVTRAFVLDPNNQLQLQAEVRTRQYPSGRERGRSRDIAEVWLAWTRALWDGKAAVTATLNAGQEWSRPERPGGDQTFYGIEVGGTADLTARLGLFLSGQWEHNGSHEYIVEQDGFGPAQMLRPSLDGYELAGGLTYAFAPDWTLRPEVLYVRDEGNTRTSDDSTTEVWMMVRRAF